MLFIQEGYKSDVTDNLSENLYHALFSSLPHLHGDILYDDRRQKSIGGKVRDAKRLGISYTIGVGKKVSARCRSISFLSTTRACISSYSFTQALESEPKFELIDNENNVTNFYSGDQLIETIKQTMLFPM